MALHCQGLALPPDGDDTSPHSTSLAPVASILGLAACPLCEFVLMYGQARFPFLFSLRIVLDICALDSTM